MFFYEVEGHMQKLSSFGQGKKIQPKKSLTGLLHEALQLRAGFFCTHQILSVKVAKVFLSLGPIISQYGSHTWL